ncbi:cob(I)yrinic acid a,c-diamide adenosyltransferase [Alkaliphilus peptidifermentans]|uniref:Corrinoid adenosyltransferase n=1 Tax=Alkaliphilus peptidifermentans DSM 18978 TaxID=1120976 RepID=A0A1G5AAV5_9FIRM|nr:cob(I)yrinic acid a,c-diamide adenosyltransferase [Alkaliphilus peptidifermentans]SCX75009.1 ATP:cob(I)alamin adenosyltransferase [Alkaliphilus peptidifermentans DSM 18978]
MAIYTKKGDKGETGLLGGSRVGKDDLRVSCYGTLDEANAAIGVAYSLTDNEAILEYLRMIQKKLFNVAAELACDEAGQGYLNDTVGQTDIEALESIIDKYEKQLGPLKEFVIPGGTVASSAIHLARTIIRRSERLIVELSRGSNVPQELVQYINRLSDALFMIARAEEQTILINKVKCKVLERLGYSESLKNVSLDLAKRMAEAAEVKAISIGVPIVFSVVDAGGNMVLLHRMNGALLASIDIAKNKAYTAAALKLPTHEVSNLVQPGAQLYGLQYTNEGKIITFGGGYPLKLHDEIIGGIGISGGTVEEDMKIANHALRVFDYERRV